MLFLQPGRSQALTHSGGEQWLPGVAAGGVCPVSTRSLFSCHSLLPEPTPTLRLLSCETCSLFCPGSRGQREKEGYLFP